MTGQEGAYRNGEQYRCGDYDAPHAIFSLDAHNGAAATREQCFFLWGQVVCAKQAVAFAKCLRHDPARKRPEKLQSGRNGFQQIVKEEKSQDSSGHDGSHRQLVL